MALRHGPVNSLGRPKSGPEDGPGQAASNPPFVLYKSNTYPQGDDAMATKPIAIDHVNIFVRDAARSHAWYSDVFGFHTQHTFNFPGTDKLRAAFLSCDPDHAHDIALFAVGEDAPLQQKGQVGLNHVAWRMENLEAL